MVCRGHWSTDSYYADVLRRGVFFAGVGGAIESPCGVSVGATYCGSNVARTVALNTPVFGASVFAGGGVRFGSVSGPLRARVVVTAAEIVGVRLVYSIGVSGTKQFDLLVGFGGGGSLSIAGSPIVVWW